MQGSGVVTEFKVVIIGDSGVGKTTFIKRHIIGKNERKYIATQAVESSSITFYTNHGPIQLSLWDSPFQAKVAGLRQGFYIGAKAAIMMFDVTNRMSYKDVPQWYKELTKVCYNIPIVLVGNKVDRKDRKIKTKHITFHRQTNLQYYDISAKSNYHYEKPFLLILRSLTGDPNLYLVEPLALKPVEIHMEQSQIQELTNQWKEVEDLPLSDDEKED